ncbi:hypothetical protein EHO57_14155 [Leptospira langatensis]|uniref:Uncharacterized protein n=1 Tax=Leptospira langatensis TaxID=2484983 RepID=A0A5R2AT36_9LEPT|nr:hypothetical protein [Leptospira langatensis]TGJ99897.1 hypothetical protein EHO57_14155 [Leptospira langatensis]
MNQKAKENAEQYLRENRSKKNDGRLFGYHLTAVLAYARKLEKLIENKLSKDDLQKIWEHSEIDDNFSS